MDLRRLVLEAEERIRCHVRETPVEFSHALSAACNCRVFLKLENLQHTGSFKFRGAMNKLLTLTDEERSRGVVAASTGNHGAAVARGGAVLGCPVLVFAPLNARESKLAAIRDHGAEVRQVGDDCLVSEAEARSHARETGMTYLSPYNDPAVIAGQGTLGVELERQMENLDAVVCSVGGGGLVSGVGGYLSSASKPVRVVGASPRASAVMHASLEAGEILDFESEETLSDGTAGGVEAGAITFGLCRRVIDEFVLVSEGEIEDAVRLIVSRHHTLIEGAAGVAVAAACKSSASWAGEDVVVVLCGANVDVDVLKRIL